MSPTLRPNTPATGHLHPSGPRPFDPDESIRLLPLPRMNSNESPLGLISQVIVGVDGSDREFAAQQWAAGLAAALGVRLRAVHVQSPGTRAPPGVFRYLENQCRRWSVPFEGQILEGGEPAREIASEAGPRDLLVLGTRRLAGREVLGSVARAVSAKAECPVLLVRLPE